MGITKNNTLFMQSEQKLKYINYAAKIKHII